MMDHLKCVIAEFPKKEKEELSIERESSLAGALWKYLGESNHFSHRQMKKKGGEIQLSLGLNTVNDIMSQRMST